MQIIFHQTNRYSYRDPAAYIENGTIYLFFTLVENTVDGQFFYVAESISTDFLHWSNPMILTEKNIRKNYSSPGNVIRHNGYYYLCMQTYPRPSGETYGNEDSRIFAMKSKDLQHWNPPEMLMVKGDMPVKKMGRMIDPYLMDDNGIFYCFFKQDGLSISICRYDSLALSREYRLRRKCVRIKEESYFLHLSLTKKRDRFVRNERF